MLTYRKKMLCALALCSATLASGAALAGPPVCCPDQPGCKKADVHFKFKGTDTKTADPCVVNHLEEGVADFVGVGQLKFTSYAVENFCSGGDFAGNHVAIFTLEDENGSKIYGMLQSPFQYTDSYFTWTGTWEFLSGTGRFAGIRGSGTLPFEKNYFASTLFNCEFEGRYFLPQSSSTQQ